MTPPAQLRALLSAGTKGPWYIDTSPNSSPDYVSAGERAIVRCYQSPNAREPSPARENAALIVAAVNSLEGLLDRVEALEAKATDAIKHAEKNGMGEWPVFQKLRQALKETP